MNVCRGITEESLISFGSLPTGKQPKSTKKFYLHVSPKPVILNQCQTPIVYEQCVRLPWPLKGIGLITYN